jgi:putative FmdB family regulatory protein
MPFYSYACTSCPHTWDERRPLGDHAVTCPECGAPGRHVFAAVPFKFRLAQHRRSLPRQPRDEVYSRTYEPGERMGDPMLDDGFERVE